MGHTPLGLTFVVDFTMALLKTHVSTSDLTYIRIAPDTGMAFGKPLSFSQRRSVHTLMLNSSKTSFRDIKFKFIAPF